MNTDSLARPWPAESPLDKLTIIAHVFAHAGRLPEHFMAWLSEAPKWEALFNEARLAYFFGIEAVGRVVLEEHLVYMSGCDGVCPWSEDEEDGESP